MNIPTPLRASLEGEHFHVIVIGGGINGAAIARELARRGRKTLLVEQHDFASGTTSRSTRIIHGGLRYLEHGEIGLVRESLREQRHLLRERSHLVHPLQFLLALDEKSRRSALSVRTGLWLYRLMGGPRLNAQNSKSDEYKLERLLDSGRRWSTFSYEDAQCEFPERLVAEWLTEAAAAGAVARNYTQVLAVDVSYGRAKGVLLRDQLSGKEARVQGTWIINASGPWGDRICQRSRVKTNGPMVGGVRGSHIVLPTFPGAPESAVYSEAVDGRAMFVAPWNHQLLVGTTEVADSGDPSRVEPSKEEIEYLLRSINQLFARRKVSRHDIKYAFAGIRPLPFSKSRDLSAISRKHYLHDHADDGAANMLSVIGGKLTTAAELARQCADRLYPGKSATASLQVTEESFTGLLDNLVTEIADAGGISEQSASAIVEWHGKQSVPIARMALSSADLRAPICPHSEHIVAEALQAFTHEYAVTLADVLLRRVPVGLGPCWSEECSRTAAARIGAVMDWPEVQIAAELEALEVERSAYLKRPGRAGALLEAAAD
jgi:glycerol-3-phosphate dehydrogenase